MENIIIDIKEIRNNSRFGICNKCGKRVYQEKGGGGFVIPTGDVLFKCWNKECIPEGYGCYSFFGSELIEVRVSSKE